MYVMSPVERARTVAAACTSGTFCTACKNDDGAPFGSHVDYVLDAAGWPVLLLNDASLHTKNVAAEPRASMFVQMPSKTGEGQPSAAMARVTLMGKIVPVEDQVLELVCLFLN
jgi:putative heme iron utilization protein